MAQQEDRKQHIRQSVFCSVYSVGCLHVGTDWAKSKKGPEIVKGVGREKKRKVVGKTFKSVIERYKKRKYRRPTLK